MFLKNIAFIILLLISNLGAGQSIPKQRIIDINVNSTKGILDRSFQLCVGAGRAAEGLRADWQRQLTQTQKDCGFKYIRFHGLLNDEMGVCKREKSGKLIYNYQYIDKLFDFLLSIHMKPFVELSFMPTALASGPETVFWWKGNKTPPRDYKEWDDLIKNLVLHFQQRYGEKEVARWYFEVWNEPNLKFFFTGGQEAYFKLYTETANTIKAISRDYRVGGPASAAGGTWLPDLIKYCHETSTPIDFVSTHVYGVKKGKVDSTGETGHIISPKKDAVYDYMIRMANIVKSSSMPNLPLHFTEWSSSYSPTDNIHDHYTNAAFVLDKIKHAGPYVASMSYWTFTDIFEELGPPFTPFHGGFGLVNLQGIKKPTYYAYKFLNQLGNTELQSPDTCTIATRDDQGNIKLLFWDFTNIHPGGKMLDQIFFTRDLPAKQLPPVQIRLNHIAAGRYKLEVYKIGYRANDAYATYYDMKRPSQLTREQVATIKKANDGHPVISATISVNASGKLEKELPMRQNDVYLFSLTKIN